MASVTLYGMRYVPIQEYQFEDAEYAHLLPAEGYVLVEVVEDNARISYNIDGVPLVGIGRSVFENRSDRLQGIEFGFTSDQNSRLDPYVEGGSKYGQSFGTLVDPYTQEISKIVFIDDNAFKNYGAGMYGYALNIGDLRHIAYIGRSAFDSSSLSFNIGFMGGFDGKAIVFKEDAFKNCKLGSSIYIYADIVIESNAFNGATFQTYGADLYFNIRGRSTIGKLGFVYDGKTNLSLENVANITDTIIENANISRFDINTQDLTISERASPLFSVRQNTDTIENISIYVNKIVGKLILPDGVKVDRYYFNSNGGSVYLQGFNESTISYISSYFPYDPNEFNSIENFGNYSIFFDTSSIMVGRCNLRNSFNHSFLSKGELNRIDSYNGIIQNSFNYSPIIRIEDLGGYSNYTNSLIENSFFHNIGATEDGRVGFLNDREDSYHRSEKQKKAHFNTNLKLYTGNEHHIYLGSEPIDESKFADRLYINKQRVYPILNYGYKSILRNIEIPGDWTLENTRIAMDNEFLYVTIRNSDGYDDLYKISKEQKTAAKMGLAAANWKDFALILNNDGLVFMGGIVRDEPGFRKVFQYNGSRSQIRILRNTDTQFGQTFRVGNVYYSITGGYVYFLGDGKYIRNKITGILNGDNGNILLPQGGKAMLWHENSTEGYTSIRIGNPVGIGDQSPAKLCKVQGYGDGVHSVTVSGDQFALLTDDGRIVVGGLGSPDGKFKEINKRVDMNGLQQVFSIDGYLCLKYIDKVMYCDMSTIDSDEWHVAYDDTVTVINAYGHFGLKKHGNKLNIYSLNKSDFGPDQQTF